MIRIEKIIKIPVHITTLDFQAVGDVWNFANYIQHCPICHVVWRARRGVREVFSCPECRRKINKRTQTLEIEKGVSKIVLEIDDYGKVYKRHLCRCIRCNYVWKPERVRGIKRCARCRTAYWNKEKKHD